MKYYMLIMLSVSFIGCLSGGKEIKIDPKFDKILNVGYSDDFNYVSDVLDSSQVFVFSSMFVNGSKYNINKKKGIGTNIVEILNKPGKSVSFAWSDGHKYCLVEDNFDSSILGKSLLISNDFGNSWSVLSTPISLPRACFFMGESSIIVEGDHEGIVQIHKSLDNGKTWSRIEYERQYKRVLLLSKIDTQKVLCLVSKTLDVDESTVMLLDIHDSSFIDLFDIKNWTIKKAISLDNNLFSIHGDHTLFFYRISNSAYEKVMELPLPEEIDIIDNVYLNKDTCIITGSSYDIGDNSKSWICIGGKTNRPI